MKNQLKALVKYIKPIYILYNILGNFFLKCLRFFVKTDDKLILFISYGGKKYDDSPKVIYEQMKKDNRFNEYKLFWAFTEPEKYVYIDKKIKVDTLKYFKIAISARVWITNSTVERGLNFKGKNTLYIDTWHGTPIKKMGSDIKSDNKAFKLRGNWSVDVMTSQSDYEADIFSRVFNIDRNKFLLCGLPRNDELVNYDTQKKEYLRHKLNIDKNKKIILYMPTFREFKKNINQECELIPPISLEKWKKKLSNEYVLLFRAHYEVSKTMNIVNDNFVKDVTNYPVLNELMIVSDILISDYSSVYFDYSVMNKPMFYFTYDYEEYSKKRGLYFDIREELNGADNEDDLIYLLSNFDLKKEKNRLISFKNKYVNYYGNATSHLLNHISFLLKL